MVQKALGSKAALKAYLVARVGIVLDTEQLQTAANGATQWSRRLRELREEGWKISSHYDRSDLRPGQYILEELPPQQADYRFAKSISQRVRACPMKLGREVSRHNELDNWRNTHRFESVMATKWLLLTISETEPGLWDRLVRAHVLERNGYTCQMCGTLKQTRKVIWAAR